MPDLAALTAAVEAGDRKSATEFTSDAIRAGIEPKVILDAMTEAMANVGARFSANEIYVPEMLVSARAMKESMVLLEPLLIGAGIHPAHTAVIGTIKGDLHDIGKNLVGMMWKGANIEVIDLGTNVTAGQFVEAAREHNASVVAVSALLTTTMVGMRDVVAAVRESLPGTRVVIGGAPVTQAYADEIGADGYSPDAAAAVELIKRLMDAA
jgi:5-methyltetrahydrofolate--homocysteine methyltransferase